MSSGESETLAFLLSPAFCGGKRAQLLLNERAQFDLAQRIRTPPGATLGEVFSFLSGLYFRGKLAYSRHFARSNGHFSDPLVITPGRGLQSVDELVTLADLRALAEVPIDVDDLRYRVPLERDLLALRERLPERAPVVLLGSIATGKYCSILLELFGERLLFPREFVGRGDMSRGGLMLRCVEERRELEYVPVSGAVRRGPRPAKLPKRQQSR